MTRTADTRTDGDRLILRARLGALLRQAREAADMNIPSAATILRINKSTLSRMETGKQASSVSKVKALAALYKLEHTESQELIDLAERTAAPAWWTAPGYGVSDEWVREMLAREAIAHKIEIFEVALVPGLFQTEGYIRSLRSAAIPDAVEAETKRVVDYRRARQEHLADNGMPTLHVVLEQVVVDRPVGSPPVWRTQLEHLVAMASRPEVTLHIIPTSAGAHPAMGVSFTTITVEEPGLDAVYMEDDRSGKQLTREAELHRYHGIFDRLTSMSWSPEQSVAYLSTLARDA
jgi:transcriptional regulator with XRE-family HTH domain